MAVLGSVIYTYVLWQPQVLQQPTVSFLLTSALGPLVG